MKHALTRLPTRLIALLTAWVAATMMFMSPASAEGARLTPVDEHAIVVRDGDVFIAAQPTEADLDAWAAMGVTTVVNMRSQAENTNLGYSPVEAMTARGMSYVEIPMGRADGVSPDIRNRLGDVLAEVDGPIVVHCRSGTRVAHAYAAHLIATGAMSPSELADFGWGNGLSSSMMAALASPPDTSAAD